MDPFQTTIAAARAAAEGIKSILSTDSQEIHSLQEWHSMIEAD